MDKQYYSVIKKELNFYISDVLNIIIYFDTMVSICKIHNQKVLFKK